MVPSQCSGGIAPWYFGGKTSIGAVEAKYISTQVCTQGNPVFGRKFVIEFTIQIIKKVACSLDIGIAVDEWFGQHIDIGSSARNDE